MKINKIVVSMITAGLVASPLAYATNGYLPIGYGAKNEAMGGASVALPLDSIAAANNPAGMVMVGERSDVGLIWFRPTRSAEITGNGAGLNGSYDGNGKRNFFIPSFGYNHMMDAKTSLGVSVYGNGGMNTQYNTSPFAGGFGGSQPIGINLEQLFIAPTWAKKVTDNSAIGVALNLAYQRFSATGIEPFKGMSSNPSAVTNNGTDTSSGYGLHIGLTAQTSPSVTVGVTYQSKTKMGKFSKYSGLFAEQGGFDIPSNFGMGIAVKATPETTVAFDIQQTNYSDVASVHNSNAAGGPLGANNGAGFGWQDVTAFKLGVSHAYNSSFTVRAGYNYGTQPIPDTQTFFNTLAPGIVQRHLTLGGTWKLANSGEVSVAYIHAFKKTVYGSNSISPGAPPAGMGGGNANLTMSEDSIGVSYGW